MVMHAHEAKISEKPVRVDGWVALIVGLVLVGLVMWSTGVPFRPMVGSLASLAIVGIGGLEWLGRVQSGGE